ARRRQERAETRLWLEKLQVVPNDTEAVLARLSGGNQQKIMLARALRLRPRGLILDEPTPGVDVGAEAGIHRVRPDAARDGAAVLVISSDPEELLTLCDHIHVLVRGVALPAFTADALTPDELTAITVRSDIAVARSAPAGDAAS